ncbi:MAG TPA: preprotein translocase subunit SecE [Solirubrobacteraceae bacterium]
MARDRKRARQRRSRPLREAARTPSTNGPARADLPGALSHTGDVDEFDAALIRGAGGVPLEQEVAPIEREPQPEQNGESSREAELVPVGGGRGGRGGGGRAAIEDPFDAGASPEAAPPARRPTQPIYVRAIAFLRASWAELHRVQWPDRRHVTQATAVVLGFVAVMGAYLGIADWAAQKIVNFIL